MIALGFFLGLLVGLGAIIWQRALLNQRLQSVLDLFEGASQPSYFGALSRLSLAVEQQRQSLQQLREVLDSIQRLIQQAPIAYLQVDRENQLIWCNQAATFLLDIALPNRTNPRLLLELVRSYDLDRLIEETRSGQIACQHEWLLLPMTADPVNPPPQQSIPLKGYGVPLPEGQVGVFLENRQEVITLQQQRDRWVSDVAHEIKTPLTSIRLVAEMLGDRVDDDLKPWMERLIGEVLHLSNLVYELLDISRLEQRSSQNLEWTQVDLPDLIQAAWKSIAPIAEPKQLELRYRGPEHLVIDGDQSRLYRVFLNLFDNAVKYSPPRGLLRLNLQYISAPDLAPNSSQPSAPLPPQQVCIDLIDEGPGFNASDLPYVFERFYRADTSRTRSPQGIEPSTALAGSGILSSTGLGLAIVRQILIAHGGSVSANNHPETTGAWIQMYLPLKSIE